MCAVVEKKELTLKAWAGTAMLLQKHASLWVSLFFSAPSSPTVLCVCSKMERRRARGSPSSSFPPSLPFSQRHKQPPGKWRCMLEIDRPLLRMHSLHHTSDGCSNGKVIVQGACVRQWRRCFEMEAQQVHGVHGASHGQGACPPTIQPNSADMSISLPPPSV